MCTIFIGRTELQTTTSVERGAHDKACVSSGKGSRGTVRDDEVSQTRAQALEKFGIDLSRLGTMTAARTNSRESLSPGEENNGTTKERGNSVSSVSSSRGIGRSSGSGGDSSGRVKQEVHRGKRARGWSSPAKGKDRLPSERKQEIISTKLKTLEMLISSEAPYLSAEGRKATGQDDQYFPEEAITKPIILAAAAPAADVAVKVKEKGDIRDSSLCQGFQAQGEIAFGNNPLGVSKEATANKEAVDIELRTPHEGIYGIPDELDDKPQTSVVVDPEVHEGKDARIQPQKENINHERFRKAIPNHR